ncbi:MAG: MFS transporter [Verrucomicrobia bacterium]|nr:MFS transporter [Verrucomicrobiota bacterium]
MLRPGARRFLASHGKPRTLCSAGVKPNDSKPLWPIASLALLTGLNLLDYIDRWVLAAVFTPLKDELHLTDEQLGTLQSAFIWGYFLTSPLFGYLGDRMPRRWLVAAGVFVWSVGTLMSGHVGTFGSLLIFRVLVGFGEASFGTISPGWIADLFPRASRNNAISIFYLAIPVGSALGYIIGGSVAAHHGWRAAFLWVGYPGLLLAFLMFLLREPPRGAAEADAPAAAPSASGWRVYLELGKIPRYVLVVAGYAAQTFAVGGFAAWAAVFLHRVHHLDNEAANHFFGLTLAGTGLVATIAGGYAATRWERRTGTGYVWVLALSSLASAPVAFFAFSVPDLLVSKVALAVSMFLIFLATGPVNTLILETVPVTMRASAMAASIFAIHMFGDVWSPRIVGRFSDQWGNLQRAVLWVLPVSLVVCTVFWGWLVMQTKRELKSGAAAEGA